MRLLILLVGTLLAQGSAASAQSKVWNCTVQSTGGFADIMPKTMTLEINPGAGAIAVSTDIGAKLGQGRIRGLLKRKVGNEQLFGWQLGSIPTSLKPAPRQFVASRATFKGRLDVTTGALKLTGAYVIRNGESHPRNRLRAAGRCR